MIYEIFFKFSKRRSRSLSAADLDIMVAAKLDQSRVLVTKFRVSSKSVNVEG